MNPSVKAYHEKRRAFIIIPEVGLILGESGQPFSHKDILANLGLDKEQISHVLQNYPRGYFLDNNLVMYQSDGNTEQEVWELKPENYFYVRKYFQDLKKLFRITTKTKIFLGVKCAKEGEIWPTINEVESSFFE